MKKSKMGNIFSKKKKNKPTTPKTTGNTEQDEPAPSTSTKQPKGSGKRDPVEHSESRSSVESADPAPAPVVNEKPGKKKNGSKSDEIDAPSPSDAAATPDAAENRTAETAALGAGVEDFGTTIVQAQKHVRWLFSEISRKCLEKSTVPISGCLRKTWSTTSLSPHLTNHHPYLIPLIFWYPVIQTSRKSRRKILIS